MDSGETITKWESLLMLLRRQLGSAPAPTVEATRRRVQRLYESATAAGVVLPAPEFEDGVFNGMSLGVSVACRPAWVPDSPVASSEGHAQSPIAEVAQGSAVETVLREVADEAMAIQHQRKLWRKRQYARRKRIADAALLGKPPEKHTQQVGRNTCACGCGIKVRGRWVTGHALRWLQWIRRIEAGDMLRESLPKRLQSELRWTRCQHCAGWIPTTDVRGMPIETRIGLECQRRAAKLEASGHGDSKLAKALRGEKVKWANPYIRVRHRERHNVERKQHDKQD